MTTTLLKKINHLQKKINHLQKKIITAITPDARHAPLDDQRPLPEQRHARAPELRHGDQALHPGLRGRPQLVEGHRPPHLLQRRAVGVREIDFFLFAKEIVRERYFLRRSERGIKLPKQQRVLLLLAPS